MGKFQMISPYPSDKVYESTSLSKCAKKFYKVLKRENKVCPYFEIIDWDNKTASPYRFKIKKFSHLQAGGNNDAQPDPHEKHEQHEMHEKINEIHEKMNEQKDSIHEIMKEKTQTEITKRISKLEKRVDKLEEGVQKKDNLNDNIEDELKIKGDLSDSEGGGEEKEYDGLIAPPKNEGNMCVIQ
jgi:hypothetical protein